MSFDISVVFFLLRISKEGIRDVMGFGERNCLSQMKEVC